MKIGDNYLQRLFKIVLVLLRETLGELWLGENCLCITFRINLNDWRLWEIRGNLQLSLNFTYLFLFPHSGVEGAIALLGRLRLYPLCKSTDTRKKLVLVLFLCCAPGAARSLHGGQGGSQPPA